MPILAWRPCNPLVFLGSQNWHYLYRAIRMGPSNIHLVEIDHTAVVFEVISNLSFSQKLLPEGLKHHARKAV